MRLSWSLTKSRDIAALRTWGLGGMAVDDLVHDPASAGGACAGARAFASAQQGIDYRLNQGLLDVLGRVNGEGLGSGVGSPFDRGEGESGKGDPALVADDFDAVAALVGGEVPDTCAECAGFEGETGGNGIFGLVELGLVGRVARGLGDGAEQKVEEVELVRG